MKQCPNPDCIIYTRLDELPDTYTRCPQCGQPLIESPLSTGRLGSQALPSDPTFPYSPPARSGREYQQGALPIYEEEYPDTYDSGYLQEDPAAAPLRTLPPRSGFPLRTFIGGVGVLALLVACLVLALSLRGRFFPQAPVLNSAAATETAVAWLRPPVNTPLTILPTIPVSGMGGQPSLPGPVAGGAPAPTAIPQQGQTTPQAQPQGSLAPAPVQDALMCAKLEKGQPVGTTTAYKPGDPFNLAVRANFGPGGAVSVLTRWYGPDGKQIYEMKKTYPQQGSYYAGFTLSKNSAWVPGDYRVDVYTNDAAQPASSVPFTVIP
jgi:hypothetical protein